MSIIGQGIMLGTFTGNYQTKTVIPNASTQLITPDSGYDALANITITGDSNFTASNIVNGVTIWGITGTYLPSLSSTTVTPNGASFTVTPSGTVVGFNQVSVVGDSNLTAANIKSGITIYGKQGTYAPALQSKSVTPNAAGFTVTPDSSYYGLSQVTISGNANLTASNIKSGVVIFGITGSYAPSLQTKTVTPNAAGFTVTNDTGYYGLSQVNVTGESNLTSENIKAGVYMWNVIGSYAPSLQKKTTNPTQAGLEVTPDTGYYGLSKVTINGDSNFTAANIACGVTIWGVTGTHQGGSSEDLTAEITNYRDLSNTQANTITNIISNLQNKTGTVDHTLEDWFLKSSFSSSDLLDYENNRLTLIRGFAFANIYGLRNLTMANVTCASQYCCYYCTNLVNVAMPKITSVNTYAFANCTNLKIIDISNVTTIGTYAFRGCTNLQNLNFDKVTSIGANAFTDCDGLTEVDLPNATSLTGTYTFALCNNIISTNITKATTLAGEFFNGCANLTTVNMPNVTCIGTYCFTYCTNLKNINCPNLTNINNYAFRNCTNLTDLTCAAVNIWNYSFTNSGITNLTLTNATTVCNLRYTTAFSNTPIASGTGNIYVPSSLVASYKAASNWSTYASQIFAIGSE